MVPLLGETRISATPRLDLSWELWRECPPPFRQLATGSLRVWGGNGRQDWPSHRGELVHRVHRHRLMRKLAALVIGILVASGATAGRAEDVKIEAPSPPPEPR